MPTFGAKAKEFSCWL